jgi:hypothetical protein
MVRDSVVAVTSAKPSTNEGNLLRERRLLLGLTVKQAATGTAVKHDKWGDVERGHTHGNARYPSAEWHAEAPIVAIMAARLGVMPGEMSAAGRADVAGILERDTARLPPPVSTAPAAEPHSHDKCDELITELIAEIEKHGLGNLLPWLWTRAIDGEGREESRDRRLEDSLAWLKRETGAGEAARAGPADLAL